MCYYVYLIVSKVKNKTISYVGYTKDLKKRLILHNSGKGAKFTRGRLWKLVYSKKYRSKNNIKINKTINKLIISGGGHDEAGGFSAKKERLSDLEKFINKEFENLDIKDYSYFDTFTIIPKKNSSIISDLKFLEPFGKSNPEPIFYFKNIKSIKSEIINKRHVQNIFKNKSGRTIKSISFDCVNSELGNYLLNFKKEFDLIACIVENNWNNKKDLELRVIDIILKS